MNLSNKTFCTLEDETNLDIDFNNKSYKTREKKAILLFITD